MEHNLFVFYIKLYHIEPTIWRRFAVPSNISLTRFHEIIQVVMGWTDSHMFEFDINGTRYTEEPESIEDGLDSDRYLLKDMVNEKNFSFTYLYDFGDGWEHELILEDNDYNLAGITSPTHCLEGSRACPPEDSGGPFRYPELLEAIRDKNHPEHKEYTSWLADLHDREFDSEKFNIEEINKELLKYTRWSRLYRI